MADHDLIRKSAALAAIQEYAVQQVGAFQHPTLKGAADAIAALPAVTVKVKPLVWDGWVTCHEAAATTGQYVVQDEGDEGWGMWTPEQPEDDHPHSFHPTIDAAKAAAQADYEARILAALEPVTQPAPTEHIPLHPHDLFQNPYTTDMGEPQPAPDAAAIREAALREAAAVCDDLAAEWAEHRATQVMSDGADECRDAILAIIPKGAADV